jgi:hypothetical protein
MLSLAPTATSGLSISTDIQTHCYCVSSDCSTFVYMLSFLAAGEYDSGFEEHCECFTVHTRISKERERVLLLTAGHQQCL